MLSGQQIQPLDVLPADGVVAAEPTPLPDVLPAPGPWTLGRAILATWDAVYSAFVWVLGVLTLIGGLAVLAAIPVLGFLSLGYLLEAAARITRSGRLRDGFPGVRKAALVGGIFLGAYVLLLPLRVFVSPLAVSAQIIEPGGPIATGWSIALTVLTVLVVVHIASAIGRGGQLRYFFWPFNIIWLVRRVLRGGYYSQARDAVCDFVLSLRLPYYFWLGFRGFVGGFIWLVIPVTLMAIGRRYPLAGLIGWPLMAFVLLYLPFVQVRFAAENRFRAFFEIRAANEMFRRAPWAHALALFVTILFALPLYLLKIEMIPREVAWIPSAVFIVFVFPARLLAGWACGLGAHRPRRAHWFFRWTARLIMPPMTLVYVFFLFFSQYAAWHGVWSLYEQHAFLLPVPFVGM